MRCPKCGRDGKYNVLFPLKRMACGYCRYTLPLHKDDIRKMEADMRLTTLRPWIDEESIDYISKILTKKSVVLEFGAGTSTVWFAERVDYIYSVEDSRFWYELVTAWLSDRDLHNASLLKPEEKIPRDTMDFVLIDGGDRFDNVRRALELPIEVIAIDDQREPKYKPAGVYLESAGWYCIKTLGKRQTNLYKKERK